MGSIFSWIVCQIILNMWLPKPMRENVTCSNFIRYTPFHDVKCVVAWLRLCSYCTPPQMKPFYNNKLSSHEKNHTYYFITLFILVSYKLIKVGAWCVALIKEQLMPRHHYLWIMITETDDIALIEKERVLVIVVLSKYDFYPHVGWQFLFLRGVQLCILRFLNQYLQMSLF